MLNHSRIGSNVFGVARLEFCPNFPNYPKFWINLPKFYQILLISAQILHKKFARGCGRIPSIPSSYSTVLQHERAGSPN